MSECAVLFWRARDDYCDKTLCRRGLFTMNSQLEHTGFCNDYYQYGDYLLCFLFISCAIPFIWRQPEMIGANECGVGQPGLLMAPNVIRGNQQRQLCNSCGMRDGVPHLIHWYPNKMSEILHMPKRAMYVGQTLLSRAFSSDFSWARQQCMLRKLWLNLHGCLVHFQVTFHERHILYSGWIFTSLFMYQWSGVILVNTGYIKSYHSTTKHTTGRNRMLISCYAICIRIYNREPPQPNDDPDKCVYALEYIYILILDNVGCRKYTVDINPNYNELLFCEFKRLSTAYVYHWLSMVLLYWTASYIEKTFVWYCRR